MSLAKQFVVVGAGVVGLTTALELKSRHPSSNVIIIAKELPGDSSPMYASAWAGGNWISCATDNGREEEWDRITYLKFKELTEGHPHCGIEKMTIRSIYDDDIDKVGLLSVGTNRIWYDDLAGGIRFLPHETLPEGAQFGFDVDTFVIDVQRYLPWLQAESLKKDIGIRRVIVDDLGDVKTMFPEVYAIFNCTGLGSYTLGGVKDSNLYPSKGQTFLVQAPPEGVSKMYYRSNLRLGASNSYIFPRGQHGGVILGGCRLNGNWDKTFDTVLGESIKRKCCALAPELGKPEDLKIISENVGFRPNRKGGNRLEMERKYGVVVIHNYGAGGAGYQASWGLAKKAVDLLPTKANL
ncbi:hypothetical protein N7456_012035 [Penicillium angulare]|uniref:FAD dependent oxidoreductase domain-containing protein n=1 Tax=Penicillium angulare TaxID=116970 RepID=A0A9W9EUZ8_9EURO|nr:hypothetical protein N7456_012035 [Penicillium angulare]